MFWLTVSATSVRKTAAPRESNWKNSMAKATNVTIVHRAIVWKN